MVTGLLRAGRTLSVVLLVLVPVQAAADDAVSFDQLSNVLRPGDYVEITERTGTRIKGHLAELTGCSIAIVKDGRQLRIDESAVTEIKLLRRSNPSQVRTADAGARCGEAPCMAMTLAFAGSATIGRGVTRLFARPKIVYRVMDLPRAAGC